jgi:glucokinase
MNGSPDVRQHWLIADMGATTTRCAFVQGPGFAVENFRLFANDDYTSAGNLLASFMSDADQSATNCALAVAAPVHGDDIEMINRDWRFSRSTLAAELGVSNMQILNDFHAIAYALGSLDEDSRIEIGQATEYRDGNLAVLGPGSGLGMAAWIGGKSHGEAMCGEGGHITVAGRNNDEDEIIEKIRQRFDHCSAERILSGPGLITLHQAMHGLEVATSEEITGNPDDIQCQATLNQFFSFLGGVAADLALISGAFGGVYLAGGIVPACIEQLQMSPFRERFEDKNRYRDYMQRIPTYVITDPVPGLRGLSAFIAENNIRG